MRKFAAALFALSAAVAPAKAEQIWLTMDQVRPYELEKPAGQIVVGNPAIADVTVQDKNRVFLFGKSPGMTNMYIVDDNGQLVENIIIRVRAAAAGMLVMHRGVMQTTYNCTSRCDPTITVGDESKGFEDVQKQVSSKSEQAKANSAE